MTSVAIPARKWADDELAPEPAPTVLVSSRDEHEVPTVRPALALAKTARAHGWAARLTYALAEVPERRYLNGNLAKAAHRLASVALRLARGAVRGWAMWHRVDDGPWRFVNAYFGTERHWSQAGKLGRPTIVDRLAVTP